MAWAGRPAGHGRAKPIEALRKVKDVKNTWKGET